MENNIFPFKGRAKHKIGTITYDVTAHFCNDEETLKSKIIYLLMHDTHKLKSQNIFASSHNNSV